MTTTHQTAERTALHGLLLLLVEAQNIARDESAEMHEIVERIENLVESAHAREMVQLARAALGAVPAPSAISAAAAGTHE